MEDFVVSARKYRPSTFLSVVGQSALTNTLKRSIASKHLAHAYLFCGPRGVGKTTCARIFAKTINCSNPTADGDACNECESCRAFNEQRSYNIHELDAASNNSVEDIRSLIEQVRIPPQVGQYSVYIIDEVHMLSQAAFNAFLKTLEEPPAHAIFILATTEKHKILPTILSRCQIYDFNRMGIEDTVKHLQMVAEKEGIKAETEALGIIAQKADGGMRDALSIFDQIAASTEGNITYQGVLENLNVLDYDYYFKLVDFFFAGKVSECLLIFNEILNKGFEAQNFVNGLSSHLRNLMVCKDTQTIQLLDVGANVKEQYLKQAQNETCSNEFLYKALMVCNQCDLNYKVSKNKRLLVELTLIRLCQLSDEKKKNNWVDEWFPQDEPIEIFLPSTIALRQGQPAQTSNPTSTPQASRTEAQPAAKQTQAQGNSKVMSFSIKDSMQKKVEVEQKKAEETETISAEREAFSQEALVKAWNDYTQFTKEKPVLQQTIQQCKPVLGTDCRVMLAVYNSSQEEIMLDEKIRLVNYLRKALHNGSIELEIRICEANENAKTFTNKELFIKMLEHNTSLSKLTKELGLELS